jgi:hypothetical protein
LRYLFLLTAVFLFYKAVNSGLTTIYNEAGIYIIRQALSAGVEDRQFFLPGWNPSTETYHGDKEHLLAGLGA